MIDDDDDDDHHHHHHHHHCGDDCEIRVTGYLTKTEEEAAEEELCEEFVGIDTDADGRAATHGADDDRTNEFNASSQRNEDRSPASTLCDLYSLHLAICGEKDLYLI